VGELNQPHVSAGNVAILWNPKNNATEVQRTPTVFTAVSLTVKTNEDKAIWTPAAGKRFRILGWTLKSSTNITFKDESTEIFQIQSINSEVPPPGGSWGNGFLSATAANKLNVRGLAETTLVGMVFGTEEESEE
jgi:hypothetical protein